MERDYTEEELKKIYRERLNDFSLPYEDAFIAAVKKEQMFCEVNRKGNSCDDIDDWYDEEDEDFEPPAQAIVKNSYLRIEGLCIDFFVTLMASGAFEMMLNMGASPFVIMGNIVAFSWRAGKYSVKLDGRKREFCKYIVTNCYTFADRLRYVFSNGGAGFLLENAIDEFCQQEKEHYPEVDAATLREEIADAANQLVKDGILVPSKENGRYLVKF